MNPPDPVARTRRAGWRGALEHGRILASQPGQMPLLDPAMGHLLRRAGFGASAAEAPAWNAISLTAAIDRLVDYETTPDDVDAKIGTPGFLGTTSRGPFEPNTKYEDAVQRWVFLLVHTDRPLQEKMALFWHNHFATGLGKVADQLSFEGAVRALAAKPSEDTDGVTGQLELFRERALGNFRDLLLAVSQDPAMVAWLDGDTNFKEKPQENYARELMELFTMGVDHYTEDDVRAGARVFTGWNLEPHERGEDEYYFTFRYDPRQHDVGEKTFGFAIYPDGGKTIPARPAFEGFQDGVDLIDAVAAHPETGAFLARKLYAFFVNEKTPPTRRSSSSSPRRTTRAGSRCARWCVSCSGRLSFRITGRGTRGRRSS